MAASTARHARLDRAKGAMYGFLIADAIAMPTHWFYGGSSQVRSSYGGPIKGYVAPVDHISGSIMGKSNTGGAGRGNDQGTIIGDVINHGKRKYWKTGSQYHYHIGLEPGENTLEACLARNVISILAGGGGKFEPEALREGYVSFMTTRGSHNDTYASTAHRMFFKNKVAGRALPDCPDNDRHNVDTTDALTMTLPVALLAVDDETAAQQCKDTVALTRDSSVSAQVAGLFSGVLRSVINGASAKDAMVASGKAVNYSVSAEVARARSDPMTAWYLPGSFYTVLFMCYKYGEDGSADGKALGQAFERGMLANANRGGENVAPGALIGAILGAHAGFSNLPSHLVEGLCPAKREALDRELDEFLATSPFLAANNGFM